MASFAITTFVVTDIVVEAGMGWERQEILLVDHTDSGDGLAPDKYVCQARNVVPSKKYCSRQEMLLPGIIYCFQARSIVG